MSIDFVIDFSCEVKGALRVEGMVALVKQRNYAELILDLARKSGDDKSPSEIRIGHVVTTPKGIEKAEMNVREMLDKTKVLGEYEIFCEKCSANVLEQPFGCFGVINYPIEAATERMLLSMLPADLGLPAGAYLFDLVKEFKIDGTPLKEMRKSRDFFEREEPEKRAWNDSFPTWELESDQLMQLMFFEGGLYPLNVCLLLWFLGVIPHKFDLGVIMDVELRKKLLRKVKIRAEDRDTQTVQVVDYFKALHRAATFDVGVLVGY